MRITMGQKVNALNTITKFAKQKLSNVDKLLDGNDVLLAIVSSALRSRFVILGKSKHEVRRFQAPRKEEDLHR